MADVAGKRKPGRPSGTNKAKYHCPCSATTCISSKRRLLTLSTIRAHLIADGIPLHAVQARLDAIVTEATRAAAAAASAGEDDDVGSDASASDQDGDADGDADADGEGGEGGDGPGNDMDFDADEIGEQDLYGGNGEGDDEVGGSDDDSDDDDAGGDDGEGDEGDGYLGEQAVSDDESAGASGRVTLRIPRGNLRRIAVGEDSAVSGASGDDSEDDDLAGPFFAAATELPCGYVRKSASQPFGSNTGPLGGIGFTGYLQVHELVDREAWRSLRVCMGRSVYFVSPLMSVFVFGNCRSCHS
jgi:hypothetical protein